MNKSISDVAELIFAYYPKMRKMYRSLVSIKDIPISITQLTCLHILNQGERLSMTELANEMCMSNQQLTKVIDTLAELEMVDRVCDQTNRRKFYAQLAPKGKKLLCSLKEEVDRKLGVVLRKKSPDEIDTLYDCIAHITTFFGNTED